MTFQFSAGGVVFRKEGPKTLILVAQHSQHHGWVFPKGLIGDHKKGEKKEETAVREVEEETGIRAEILKPLTPVTYWFVFEKEKIRKTVYYFLMDFIEDTGKRDKEMENVAWLEKNEVMEKLTYKSDKSVWQEAERLIANSA